MKMTDLFRLTARVGDRFGGWEVGGSIDLIEIYRFPPQILIWISFGQLPLDCAIRHAAAV